MYLAYHLPSITTEQSICQQLLSNVFSMVITLILSMLLFDLCHSSAYLNKFWHSRLVANLHGGMTGPHQEEITAMTVLLSMAKFSSFTSEHLQRLLFTQLQTNNNKKKKNNTTIKEAAKIMTTIFSHYQMYNKYITSEPWCHSDDRCASARWKRDGWLEVDGYPSARKIDLMLLRPWPLISDPENLTAIPTRMLNICGKFHWNSSTR